MTSNTDKEITIEEEPIEEEPIENEPEEYELEQQRQRDQDKKSLSKLHMLGLFLFLLGVSYVFVVTLGRRTDGIPEGENEDQIGEFPLAVEDFEEVEEIKDVDGPTTTHEHDGEDDNPKNDEKAALLASLEERMKPRNFLYNTTLDDEGNVNTIFPNKQFFHLHHMKTGGTSIDSLLRCATSRLSRQIGKTVPKYSLSECSAFQYQKCITHKDEDCASRIESAASMSFCAPLAQANAFHWDHADAITTIRNPIDRVWSMYRFTTKHCYCCLPLREVYERHANGTLEEVCPQAEHGVCIPQLFDHQTRNLLTTLDTELMDDETKLDEAVHNLKYRFSVVGLTHELPTYVQMLGLVFPWLSEDGANIGNDHDNDGDDGGEGKKCVLQHKNSSPGNNGCGPGGKHLPLDDEPDEETRQVILDHNQVDMEMFRKALEHFELQKQVLELD